MAESDTTRFGLRRWTEDTDTPHRTEFDTAHLNIENRAAGFLQGTAAARPVAAAAYDRFLYYARDTDAFTMCVDTTGVGNYAWQPASNELIATTFAVTPPNVSTPYGTVSDAPSANLVRNPRFAVDLADWLVTGAATILREADADAVGGYRMSVSIPTGVHVDGVYHYQGPAAVGDIVASSAFLASPNAPKTVRLDLQFVDAAGAVLSVVTLNVTVGISYARHTVTGTAPANTVGARLVIRNNNTDQGAYAIKVAGVQLEMGTRASSYLDGSLGPGYTWDGTPHASVSRRAGGLHVLDASGDLYANMLRAAGDTVLGGFDLVLGNGNQIDRGDSGHSRAMVKFLRTAGGTPALYLNYGGDFPNGTILGGAQVQAVSDGTAAAPAFSFYNDLDTGIARGGIDRLDFIAGGAIQAYFGSGNLRMAVPVRVDDGTASVPTFSFVNDTNTGLYRDIDGRINFGTNGVLGGFIQNGLFYANGVVRIGGDGTAAEPSYSWNNDSNTGLYRAGVDELAVSLGGSHRFSFRVGDFIPAGDNIRTCGTSAYRWSQIWAVNGTIQTSDETQKTSVEETPLGLAFVRALKPIRFKFNDGSRPHDGFGAQQVKEALTAIGVEDAAAYIDPAVEASARTNPYAAAQPASEFVADYLPDPLDPNADEDERAEHAREEAEGRQRAQEEWAEVRAAFDAESEAMRTAPKGIRYTELLAPAVKAIQELANKVEVLETENSSLRTTVADLVARVEALEAR